MMLTPGRVGGIGFRPIAKARAMACGSNPRALPDLMAAASAADPQGMILSKVPRHPLEVQDRSCFVWVDVELSLV